LKSFEGCPARLRGDPYLSSWVINYPSRRFISLIYKVFEVKIMLHEKFGVKFKWY
jgi:hypothetical protein